MLWTGWTASRIAPSMESIPSIQPTHPWIGADAALILIGFAEGKKAARLLVIDFVRGGS